METSCYDEHTYIYRVNQYCILKIYWSSKKDIIEITLNWKNGYVRTFAKRDFKKSTLAEMRTVFDYLVDYYRTYPEG